MKEDWLKTVFCTSRLITDDDLRVTPKTIIQYGNRRRDPVEVLDQPILYMQNESSGAMFPRPTVQDGNVKTRAAYTHRSDRNEKMQFPKIQCPKADISWSLWNETNIHVRFKLVHVNERLENSSRLILDHILWFLLGQIWREKNKHIEPRHIHG